jgi:hypothetical protein
VTIALTRGLTRSICAMNVRMTSVAETLRVRISRASFAAPVKQNPDSVMGYISTMSYCSCV